MKWELKPGKPIQSMKPVKSATHAGFRWLLILMASSWLSFSGFNLNAAPITFNSALPVAKKAFVLREQVIVKRFDRDASTADRDLKVNGLVSILGYGITPKLALFTALPYLDKSINFDMGSQNIQRSSQGISDLKSFARYTFIQQDGRGKTFRVAAFAGVKIPTGKSSQQDAIGNLPPPLQTGSGAWDLFGGLVLTYQTLGYQIDAQISADNKGSFNGFEFGDRINVDFSYQYRLFPKIINRDTHSFWYAVMEANWSQQGKDSSLGISDFNSGGSAFYLTPGLQYVTSKYILEAAIQLPVIQGLNGTSLETDFVLSAGFRVNF